MIFGETTLVIAVNPVINDANEASVPAPGIPQEGIALDVDEGESSLTDARGVAVLAPVAPGDRTLSVDSIDAAGSVTVSIADQDLREVTIAADASGVAVMSDVLFAFGGTLIEVTPDMPLGEVNEALATSNGIVFFRNGIYRGDLSFSGSNVTLFGEGFRGGQVTIEGNVTVGGSSNRIRGAIVLGDLDVPGSDVGISFTRVAGNLSVAGSDAKLVLNELCGTVDIAGSGLLALGNQGMAPLAAPLDCL